MVLPERKMSSVEEFIERYPTVKKVMIDGTERPISRPKDKERQKLNYSGKKKRHTRKHIAAVDEKKRVLILSKAREGKVHDKRAHDEDDFVGSIRLEIPIEADSGFLGLQKQYENIHLPHKKPKDGELNEIQQEENRVLSARIFDSPVVATTTNCASALPRVVCENAFAGVKRYGAVSQIYRNRVNDFDDRLMLSAAGLWNFYLIAA